MCTCCVGLVAGRRSQRARPGVLLFCASYTPLMACWRGPAATASCLCPQTPDCRWAPVQAPWRASLSFLVLAPSLDKTTMRCVASWLPALGTSVLCVSGAPCLWCQSACTASTQLCPVAVLCCHLACRTAVSTGCCTSGAGGTCKGLPQMLCAGIHLSHPPAPVTPAAG